MTCMQMGGPCDSKVSGNTPDELMGNGMMHLQTAHPDMAAKIQATPPDDPMMVAWNEKFKADWDATPEDN